MLPKKKKIKPAIAVVGTFDSKAEEHFFLKDRIERRGLRVVTINIGTKGPSPSPVSTDLFIRLQKNTSYFRAAEGLPRFDHLVFRFTGLDPNASLAQLLSGECDILDRSTQLDEQLVLTTHPRTITGSYDNSPDALPCISISTHLLSHQLELSLPH